MSEHAKLWLDIAKINQEKSVQMREEGVDLAVVTDYADAIRAGEDLPPVVVFRDGKEYYLADGWHRLKAHESLGKKQINVKIIAGTHRDAVLHAIGANASHGRSRTLADKEKAILFLLNDPEWRQLADAELLRKAKINDPSFVNRVREKYGLKGSKIRTVVRGGRMTQIDVSNLGRKAFDYAAEFKATQYNENLSYHLTKAVKHLEKYMLSSRATMNRTDALALRKKILNGLAEVENRILAAKARARK